MERLNPSGSRGKSVGYVGPQLNCHAAPGGPDVLLELGPLCREETGKIGEQADLHVVSGRTADPQKHRRGGDDCEQSAIDDPPNAR